MSLRLLPLVYSLVMFALAFFWPTLRVYKQTGLNPYRLGSSDSAHDFIGRMFRVTLLGILALVSLYAFLPHVYTYLAPITWLEQPSLKFMGWVLLVASLLWILIAQKQMQASWRIGIDQENKTELIQHGLFAISRNPIFLGMRVMLLGFFLILPSSLTLLFWLLGDVLMQIQVRLEEAYLSPLHGSIYHHYCQKVRRWL